MASSLFKLECPLCGRKLQYNKVDKKWHCIGSLFCGYETKDEDLPYASYD